jgi:flagellar protein FlbD
MIELTRLNGHKILVNCDLLQYAEASPDTVLTLSTGDKIVVLETCSQVMGLAVAFRAKVMRAAWPERAFALDPLSALAAPSPQADMFSRFETRFAPEFETKR